MCVCAYMVATPLIIRVCMKLVEIFFQLIESTAHQMQTFCIDWHLFRIAFCLLIASPV